MSSTMGNKFKITIFGESHGPAIGAVIDAPPAGFPIDFDKIMVDVNRRRPGTDKTATPRKEADTPKVLSGLLNGVTTGAPLAIVIENTNTHSADYNELSAKPRPSHADYDAYVHYNGYNDVSGGGHFSGRLTAPLTVAGSIAKQILATKGIAIVGHVSNIGGIKDKSLLNITPDCDLISRLELEYFSVIDQDAKVKMTKKIDSVRTVGDSIGGAVEVAVYGMPTGVGEPMFDGIENVIASAVFGVPAVKSVSFGLGQEFATAKGSEVNDSMYYENDEVKCATNNCGGITGGISNGMPIIVSATFKPTPSISIEQKTVNLKTKENVNLSIKGRHDPCIVPRGLVAVESAVAISILDLLMGETKL